MMLKKLTTLLVGNFPTQVEKICLFSHGGAIHDTIASVERNIF
mgnify:CR=1 FL=1